MKNPKWLFAIIFLSISFFLNGCYTILWTPEEDFPDAGNYEYYDSYYAEEYVYYYDYPWWLSFSPVYKYRNDNTVYERDNSTGTLRNNGNGRGDSGREILVTPPPTITYTPSDDGTENSSGNNNSSGTNRTESVNSGSNNTRQDSGSDNSVRNNDGNRNNGRRR